MVKYSCKRCNHLCNTYRFFLQGLKSPAHLYPIISERHMSVFCLSDGAAVNTYGFRVRTSGIKMDRFNANPVMLAEHYNSIGNVLGKWTKIKVDGEKLIAEPEFDNEDDAAKKVSGKVDRGYVKGASIGITFNGEHMERQPDGVWELMQCELLEASICAIPSNGNALKLFNPSTGHLMTDSEVKLSLGAFNEKDITNSNEKQQLKMKKIVLSVAALMALGIQERNTNDGVDADAINDAVAKLKADLDAANLTADGLKKANEKMTAELQAQKKEKAETLIDEAIAQGKLAATEKEDWVKLAMDNQALAEKTLSSIPAKQSLASGVQNPAASTKEVKTEDDFQKMSHAEQVAWKDANPDDYKKMFA